MKKLSIICSLLMVLGVMFSPAFAVNDYDVDHLEGANPGGPAPASFKTWDSAGGILVTEGTSFDVDVWLRNASGAATNGGVYVAFDDTLLAISDVEPNDGSVLAGPWVAPSVYTAIGTDAFSLTTSNFGGAAPDTDGDLIVCRVTFDCIGSGVANVTAGTVPSFGTWAPPAAGYVSDALILDLPFDICQQPATPCGTDADCPDADVCDGVDSCVTAPAGWCGYSGNACVSDGNVLDCDDSIDCTDDTCDATTGCSATNIPDDGACDDGRSCTTDACDQGAGTGCSNTENDAACDDSNGCTDDDCDAAGPLGTGCVITNNTNPCDDSQFCTETDTCAGGSCVGTGDTCDDSNSCTDDTCIEAIDTCVNDCNATSPTEPCCDDTACDSAAVCAAGGVIKIGDFWANCGDVGVKIDICLENLATPVGGFQMDICENPVRECAGTTTACVDDSDCTDRPCIITGADPDCLTCVECEMTERTVLFDCVVNEIADPAGCCRVILFSKNPGGLINPGECDIVTIVYELSDDPECCDECITIDGTGIIVTDEYGYDILGVMGETGEVCPYECGDIEPGCAELVCSVSGSACAVDDDCPLGSYPTFETCNGCAPGSTCGDGDVDIFDILLEVDFALGSKVPDSCQAGTRSNVPTGTPPYCIGPDVNCAVTQIDCSVGGYDVDCIQTPPMPPGMYDLCVNNLPFQIDILDIMVIIDMALERQDCCSYYYAGIIW